MGGGTPRSAKSVAKGSGGASKRKKVSDAGGDGDVASGSGSGDAKRARREKDTVVTVGKQTSGIKNKIARSELYGKLKHHKALERKKKRVARQKEEERALAAGETPKPRQVPKTIENQRVRDETFVEAGDEEVAEEDAEDEFASYFSQSTSPKVIITTSRKPSGEMFKFLENLFTVVPNAYYYARRAYTVQEIQKHAATRGFTDLLVFNENKKFSHGARVNGLLHVHLPEGPTCLYRLSSLVLTKKIKNHGRATNHYPELILNNFSTRMGHRVGRMFASVFPQRPEFNGRRVVTFHNQRDFIFFRHHRYIFETRLGKKRQHQGHLATAEVPDGGRRDARPLRQREEGQGAGEEGKGAKEKSEESEDESDSGSDSDSEEEDFSDAESDGEGGARAAGKKKKPRRNADGETEETSVQARLQELGPRFTLKLMSVQKGTFDSEHGEYEYVRNGETDGTKRNRRKFVL
jgi:ribosome production factor 1